MHGDRWYSRPATTRWLSGLGVIAALTLAAHSATVSTTPPLVWIAIGVVLVSCLVLVLARRSSISDGDAVHRMTVAARDLAAGNFDRTLAANELSRRDLRELGEAINALAARARRDIAEMKRLERVRSEFLGNVSHELRTPIFSVQGYLETLIDGAVDDPSVRDDFLRKAHQNVLRLHNLLNDLIEISRIESGEMKMSFRYFDAVEYFGSIVDEMQPTAEMAGVSLSLRVIGGQGDRSAFGDRDRLKQVLVNLVENAIKYNRPDGSVVVELEFGDTQLTVRVIDSGIGIPFDDQSRIFERFYRVDKNRSRAVGGSGLGLAIVKHIIEAHRSTIHVESHFGTGSTFSFGLKR